MRHIIRCRKNDYGVKSSIIIFPAILTILVSLTITTLLSQSVFAQGIDPKRAIILQVIKSTIQDIGFTEYEINDWINDDNWAYEGHNVSHCQDTRSIYIDVSDFLSIQTATDSMKQYCEPMYGNTKGSLHGFPACYKIDYALNVNLTTEGLYVWQADNLFFTLYVTPSEDLIIAAEILYNNAVKYGLITEVNPVQDYDGDGVPDNVDQCPNTQANVLVDSDGCPVIMQISLKTDKATYLPGETAIISGSIANNNGPLAGAGIKIDINGSIANLVSAAAGSYKFNFTIPLNPTVSTYPVTVTASYSGYHDVTEQTTFAIGQDMTVTITPDKDSYSIGDTVYCNIKVKDASGKPVPFADIAISTIRLVSGRKNNLSGLTDALGENLWSFVWGQDAAGKIIAEGKLKVEVSVTKDGFNKAITELLISGCGDLIVDENEFCLDCPEDCPCGPNETCDPSSDFKNSSNMCSPKSAYVFVSKNMSAYLKTWTLPYIYGIKKFYRKSGYKVVEINEDDIKPMATYLSRPSTKAMAWFGHGEEPGGKATIEGYDATGGGYSIKDAIGFKSKEVGGFLYRCQFEVYAAKWVDIHNKIETIAEQHQEHPDLDYLYNFSCYSLDDNSVMNYLVRDGGIYWGHRGVLHGTPLTKIIK